MSDMLEPGQTSAAVASLAVPVETVEDTLPIAGLDAMFRSDPAMSCVAVLGNAPVAGAGGEPVVIASPTRGGVRSGLGWGMVTRARFDHLMTGPMGYGRVLLARKTARAVTDWNPLLVSADTAVVDVARRIVEQDAPGARALHRAATLQPLTDPAATEATPGVVEAPTEILVVQAGEELRRVSAAAVFRALSAQLAVQALTDPLTGLANRDHFRQFLHRCCRQPVPGERLAVVYIDLDGFKGFNDSYGHGVGDRVLQVVADRLRSSCRSHDLPARLGGDEFAVIVRLPGEVPVQQAADSLAQRVLACLGGTITVGQLVLPSRASVGIAVAGDVAPTVGTDTGGHPAAVALRDRASEETAATGPRDAGADGEVFARADVLLREADLAMYQAKVAGGHRAQIVTDVRHCPGAETSARVDHRALHQALEAGEFVLHFQPIVEVNTGQLGSVEALIRWQHPSRGLLEPAQFLDAVADAGLAAQLDRFVLGEALDHLQAWTKRWGPQAPPAVNVNVSVPRLQEAGMADAVLEAVHSAGLTPHRLRLEVPESASVQLLRAASEELARLRSAGVLLTLDDLGAGVSTLRHLTDLTWDGVKVDARFVAGMEGDEREAAVVRMLVELGVSTGLTVTAEGVETDGQLSLLRDMAQGRQVHVQGYLVGRPVPSHHVQLPWASGIRALAQDREERVTPGGGVGEG